MNAIRTSQLLEAMAACHQSLNFIDGDFLSEHEIRSDELTVFELAGNILKGYLALKPSEQVKIQLLGAGMEPALAEATYEGLRRQELQQEMAAIKL